MQSAPAHMPAISVASFGAGLADPDLILRLRDVDLLGEQTGRPVCSASAITGTNPAHDTRWSSSNTAEAAGSYATLAPEVPFRTGPIIA